MCEAIVDSVVQHARGREVARVRVRVGQLHRVVPEAFAQSFALAARGTPAADAATDIVFLPVRGECRSCGAGYEGDELPALCPSCRRDGLELRGGDELVVESIEYRTAEHGG